MKYKPLGTSQEFVSAIGQGTMGLGGFFSKDTTSASLIVRQIRLGIELGMTLIDTAEIYGAGHAEELVGQAVKGLRSRAFIASKFSPEHSSFTDVIAAVESSLIRLDTPYLDLIQTHWRNYRIPLEETAQAMRKLVMDGKVRFLGVSNFTVGETQKLQEYLGDIPLVSTQQEYNMLDRSVEQEILPYCADNHLTLFAYSPLMQGKIHNSGLAQEELTLIAKKYNASAPQIILNWLAANTPVIVIPKAGNEHHLLDNAAALEFTLEENDFQALSKIFTPTIQLLPTNRIKVADDAHRNVYRTVEEAIENKLNLNPSPVEMAQQISEGNFLKPIKVKPDPSDKNQYLLIEGRVKYWGWVIAYGHERPIPALINV